MGSLISRLDVILFKQSMQPTPQNPNMPALTPEQQAAESVDARVRPFLEVCTDVTMLDGIDALRDQHEGAVNQKYKDYYSLLGRLIKGGQVKSPFAQRLLGEYRRRVPQGSDVGTRVDAQRSVALGHAEKTAQKATRNEIEGVYLPDIAPGIDPSDASFDQLSDAILQAVQMDATEWYGDDIQDGSGQTIHTPGVRDKMIQAIEARNAALQNSQTTPEGATSPEQLLENLRTAKYDAFVEYMKGPAFGKKRGQLKDAYDAAERAYFDAIEVQNQQQIAEKRSELQAEGKDEATIFAELRDFVKSISEQIAGEDQAKQHSLLVERSGWLGKKMEQYANLSSRKKLLVGLGLGALTFGTGLGVGVVAGALGGIFLTGAAAGAGAGLLRLWGGARTYQLRRAEIYKSPLATPDFAVENGDTADTLHLRQRAYLEKNSRDRLANGEKVKKRAVAWALGTVALGGAAGVIGHSLAVDGGISLQHAPGGQLQHWAEDRGWLHSVNDANQHVDAHPNEGTLPSSGSRGDYIPPKGGGDVVKDYLKEHAAARKIDRGEGWYQTFKELGVKQGDWQELLQKVGPKLHDIRYDGVRAAYWDNNAHEWRINMTDNGKMSPEALRTIVKTANSEGFLKHSLDLSSADPSVATVHSGVEVPGYSNAEVGANPTSGAATTEAANQLISSSELTPATTVGHREGWLQTLGELKKAGVIDIPSQYYGKLLKVAGPELAKIHYSDGTPVAYYHHLSHEWRMYDSPDGGRLHPDAIRLLERLARQSGYAKAA